MSKFQFLFHEIDSDESITRLARSLGTDCVNGIIKIPEQTGKGIIRKIKMEEGLHMRLWDFELKDPFVFNKLSDTISPDRIFHIAYILNPEALLIKAKGIEKEFRVQGGMNILFVSNDIDMEVEIATEKGLHAIDISFTSSWLLKAFAGADKRLEVFIDQLLKSTTPTVFFESTSAVEYRMLVDLHASAFPEAKDPLHIKAETLYLLSCFFNRLFNKSFSEVMESKFFYHDKMMEVEKLLLIHMKKKFPGIEVIARQMALSVSTLKRHFKLMFGKSIYEYYLEMKMDFAKRILLERTLSVNEVANMLDYEKASNFISMFKRHHGISPGGLRRKSA